jgi:hypothetical protein
MDTIIIMSWCIWMARNDMIFRGILPDMMAVKNWFESEFALVILRAKQSRKTALSTWLSTHM